MSSRIEELVRSRLEDLPRGLREHISRVQGIALDLADHHQIDREKTELGALAHDLARSMKGEQLLLKAQELNIPIHPVEEQVPILLHGPVAAEMLKTLDGLEDPDIYEAVYWHSTAHKGMGPAAQIVFLADKLDPRKARRYPFIPEIKEAAAESLDRAVRDFLTEELSSLLHQGSLLHPASVEARNDLVLKTS
jgi:predicted HD superfamily hydrolase involved in NAD metabolism